jgi:chromosome partitioning protein
MFVCVQTRKGVNVQTIAVVNQKGGVGKSTSTCNLAVALGQLGKKVLAVDLDAQAHLSLGFGVELGEDDLSIYDFLFNKETSADQVLRDVGEGVDLLPADINLSAADMTLINEFNRETVLKRKLAELADRYDLALIDNPPSLSLLVINSLTASDFYLIPVASQYYALKGMGQLMQTIDKVRSSGLNPDLELLGVLATMVDSRTNISKGVVDRIRENFGEKVFETSIPRTVRFEDSAIAHKPFVVDMPKEEAALAYQALAREVISRG